MIVIGADVHKSTHALAVVDAATGQLLGEREIPAKEQGSRRGEREPGKSDQIDVRAIARAVLRDGIERFPIAYLDENAVEIRLLCDHRDTLVNERTRLIDRLRINLVILDPELEAKIPSRKRRSLLLLATSRSIGSAHR